MNNRSNSNPKKEKRDISQEEIAKIWRKKSNAPTDVDGSFTGTPIDGGKPVQDADDL